MIVERLALEPAEPERVEKAFRGLPDVLYAFDTFSRRAAVDRAEAGYVLEAYESASGLCVTSRFDAGAQAMLRIYLSGRIGQVHALGLGTRYGGRGLADSWTVERIDSVRAPDVQEIFFLAEHEDPEAYRLAH